MHSYLFSLVACKKYDVSLKFLSGLQTSLNGFSSVNSFTSEAALGAFKQLMLMDYSRARCGKHNYIELLRAEVLS